MKKIICFVFVLVMLFSVTTTTVFAKSYTSFNIVFEEKDGENVNGTEITVFASVDEGTLVDRTEDFTMEGVEWFKYLSKPEDGKTADDYDYVDEELKIYGILCTDEDVFDHDNYDYFLRIARLYALEEDSFDRNVKINGVDIEELNGICYNTGNEFYIKTVSNGFGGSSGDGDVTDGPAGPNNPTDNPTKDKCKVCGICPIQPLGICLFIWIAIILVVVIIVFVLVSKDKKKDKKNND